MVLAYFEVFSSKNLRKIRSIGEFLNLLESLQEKNLIHMLLPKKFYKN